MAGVSISTVSKIVNNKAENINIETKNRVLKIVKEYNYTPYGAAKSISSARTFLIGVLLKRTSQMHLMLNGILQTAQKHGYNVLICDSADNPKQELKHITALCRHKIDGVLWEPVCEESLSQARHFKEQNIPFPTSTASFSSGSLPLDFSQMGYAAAKSFWITVIPISAVLQSPAICAQIWCLEGFKNVCLTMKSLIRKTERFLF